MSYMHSSSTEQFIQYTTAAKDRIFMRSRAREAKMPAICGWWGLFPILSFVFAFLKKRFKILKEAEYYGILAVFPWVYDYRKLERKHLRREASLIIGSHTSRILGQLIDCQCEFRAIECSANHPIGSSDEEVKATEEAKRLAGQMLYELARIPRFSNHFRVLNPTDLVENPFPGFLSTERAQKYCIALLDEFCSPSKWE